MLLLLPLLLLLTLLVEHTRVLACTFWAGRPVHAGDTPAAVPGCAGVLSEIKAAGQQVVYRRNEQLQTGPAGAQDQDGMELEDAGQDEQQVRLLGCMAEGECVPGEVDF